MQIKKRGNVIFFELEKGEVIIDCFWHYAKLFFFHSERFIVTIFCISVHIGVCVCSSVCETMQKV